MSPARASLTTALGTWREQRHTPAAEATVALLNGHLDGLRASLVHAAPAEVPMHQGAARLLEQLLRDLTDDPSPRDNRDGAYT